MPKFSAILLSGGIGSRFGSHIPKQYQMLNGKPVALHSLELFLKLECFEEIVIVCDPYYQNLFSSYSVKFALPGKRRQDSLESGFNALNSRVDFIVSHDMARPLVSENALLKLIKEGIKTPAATLGKKIPFTIKKASPASIVEKTLQRELIWEIQTPQLIQSDVLSEGFTLAKKHNLTLTDDVSLAEILDKKVTLIENLAPNPKVTTPDDLKYVSYLMQNQSLS